MECCRSMLCIILGLFDRFRKLRWDEVCEINFEVLDCFEEGDWFKVR